MKNAATMLFGLVLCASLTGQRETPWTSDEATIAAVLPVLARGDEVPFAKRQMFGAQLGSHMWQRLDAPSSAGPGYVGYAWPTAGGGRTFAITDRGVPMFTDQRARPYGQGECIPEWRAIVAKGSEPLLAQALDVPGRATDDQMWQPVAMVKGVRSRLVVRGTDGEPIAGIGVAVAPASWFGDPSPGVALGDAPFAVGLALADDKGAAHLTSVPVNGAHVALTSGSSFLPVPLRIERRDEGPALIVDRGEVSRFLAKGLAANESAAIAILKNLSSAQSQMRACGANDANGNGVGEYAFYAQLCGAAEVQSPAAPGGETKISPPVLSVAFRNVHGSCVVRSGYVFQIFLPGKAGWVTEAPCGGARGVAVDPLRAETLWCAYAWPVDAGRTGNRAFHVCIDHVLSATDNQDRKYSGRDRRPAAEAAHVGHESIPKLANDAPGNDGRPWRVIH